MNDSEHSVTLTGMGDGVAPCEHPCDATEMAVS